jgi:hypothetical protein
MAERVGASHYGGERQESGEERAERKGERKVSKVRDRSFWDPLNVSGFHSRRFKETFPETGNRA